MTGQRKTNRRVYIVAEKIHAILAEHCAKTGSQDESTCALRVAAALWVKSPKVCDSVTR